MRESIGRTDSHSPARTADGHEQSSPMEHFYPEISAGGYSRVDSTIDFYLRVNALLKPEMTVLDFGAGRGVGIINSRHELDRKLRILRGKVAKVIGVDVDSIVSTNPGLDEAAVMFL